MHPKTCHDAVVRHMYVRMRCGFGNCIRVLCSAMYVAEKTGRKLVLLKHKSKYSYDAGKLFDLEAMGVTMLDEADAAHVYAHSHAFYESEIKLLDYYTNDGSDILACQDRDILVHTSRAFCSSNDYHEIDPQTGYARYLSQRRATYQRFRLRSDLQHAWDCVEKQLPDHYIGIHIRRDDLGLYQMSAECYQIEAYIDCARRVPHVRKWVLCTDDNKLRKSLASQMHHVTMPDAFKCGNEALFDFLLLSRSTHIVGTFSSSFSLEAFLFGTRPRNFTTVGAQPSFGHVPGVAAWTGSARASRGSFWAVLVLLGIALAMLGYAIRASNRTVKIVACVLVFVMVFLLLASFFFAAALRDLELHNPLPHTIVW